MPNTTLQQTSSPYITTCLTHCTTEHRGQLNTHYHQTACPSSPQLTYDVTTDYRLQQNRRTFTNHKNADWTQITEDIESAFSRTTPTTNIHTVNIIFTNIILMAEKHNIPKGKMLSNCRLLPDHIVCKITPRNNIRRANTCDPALKLLNEEITSDIQKHNHMEGASRRTLGSQVNTHTRWKNIHGLSNRAPPTITFNKITTIPKHVANCFIKQFTHCQTHNTQNKQIHWRCNTKHTRIQHYTHYFSGPRVNKTKKK